MYGILNRKGVILFKRKNNHGHQRGSSSLLTLAKRDYDAEINTHKQRPREEATRRSYLQAMRESSKEKLAAPNALLPARLVENRFLPFKSD